MLVLVHIDLGDVAIDARADLDKVAIDGCVVGVFVIGGVPPEEKSADQQHRDESDDDETAARAGAWNLRPLLGWSGLLGILLRHLLSSHVILVIALRHTKGPGQR